MLRFDGWSANNIWENSSHVRDLYLARVRDEVPELTYQTQAAEILAEIMSPGDMLLDAGCGAGQFYHALRRRGLETGYHGIDPTAPFIEMGRRELPAFGLSAERLRHARIEDLAGSTDVSISLNVLSNLDDILRPLERLLKVSRKAVLIRESIKTGGERSYVRDKYLDQGVDLKVYVNSYDRDALERFVASYGFKTRFIEDVRTGGKPEMVIDHPHHWTFALFERKEG